MGMPQKQEDLWTEEVNSIFSEIDNVASSVFREFFDIAGTGDADNILAAALSLSPDREIEKFISKIKKVEDLYRQIHNSTIKEVCKQEKINHSKWINNEKGFIKKEVSSNISSLYMAMSELKSIIIDVAKFDQENSGLTGFAKNAIRGWLNPIDGISEIFGEGSYSRTHKILNGRLSSAGDLFDSKVMELKKAVKEAYVNHLNENTVGCLREIDEILERRSEETAIETRLIEKSAHVYDYQEKEKNIKISSIWRFMLGGLSAGLVVLAGIIVLKYIGFL